MRMALQSVTTATIRTTPMSARLTVITARTGSTAVSSWALARGTDGAGAMATVIAVATTAVVGTATAVVGTATAVVGTATVDAGMATAVAPVTVELAGLATAG
jgi:flavorubredoxin